MTWKRWIGIQFEIRVDGRVQMEIDTNSDNDNRSN